MEKLIKRLLLNKWVQMENEGWTRQFNPNTWEKIIYFYHPFTKKCLRISYNPNGLSVKKWKKF